MKRLGAAGGKLCFAGLNKPVRQIFDIAGLSLRVEMCPTVEEALQKYPPA
jgi:anti-anti-sigma regulatory factor